MKSPPFHIPEAWKKVSLSGERSPYRPLGTLRNYDILTTSTEPKKSNRFNKQNNNSARCCPCTTTTWNGHANFKFTSERERQGDKFYMISVWTRARSLLVSSKLNSLLLSNWAPWNNREKKWKDAKFIFQRRFHGHRRCRIQIYIQCEWKK